jgi:transglutaminase-like putative cysteine protease
VKFEVEQRIEYAYSKEVFLEPHTIRLRPRSDPTQRELAFHLTVEPQPMVLSEGSDPEGHPVAHAWFEGLTDRLTILTRIEAETLRNNPFDFLFLDSAHERLPLTYADPSRFVAGELAPSPDYWPEVDQLSATALVESGGRTTEFLATLCRLIYDGAEVVIREHGDAMQADETWRTRQGACRDLAVLFNECCRRQGLAARFVSGYQCGDPDSTERYLHAWSEVYLPGGGWRGFDPTQGLLVGDGHLALASSAMPEGAAAVTGNFRGTGATARMSASLEITARP